MLTVHLLRSYGSRIRLAQGRVMQTISSCPGNAPPISVVTVFGEDHRSRAKADASPGAVLRPPAAWHAPFSPGPRRSPVPDRWRHGRWVGRVREKELIRAAPTRDASGPKAGGSRSPVARKGRLDS